MKKLLCILMAVLTLSLMPLQVTATAQGTNGAKLSENWDAKTATLTLTVISNGRVTITVE